jgi:hypothetical protein
MDRYLKGVRQGGGYSTEEDARHFATMDALARIALLQREYAGSFHHLKPFEVDHS